MLGTVADAHNMTGLSHLAAILVGVALALGIATLIRAYRDEVRVPSLAREFTAMVQAMDAGQPVSGSFSASLRDLLPGAPLRTRWLSGRVMITPESVVWTRSVTRSARDLSRARCTGERKRDPSYTEMSLTIPTSYRGENIRVLTLRADGAADGADVELAAPAQLLDIIRYSLGRTGSGAR